MIYENNEQVKNIIKNIMKKEDVTYDDIAAKTDGGSRQNAYKTLNKNQLKLDDVKKFCDALGYKFEINIVKETEELKYDLYNLYVNDQFMKLILEMIKLAKDVDYEQIYKNHLKIKEEDK